MMRRRGRPGLVGTVARTAVIAGTAKAVVGSNNAPAAQPAAPVAADTNSADAQIIEIQKFSELKNQGLITEEEFNAKKRQILGL